MCVYIHTHNKTFFYKTISTSSNFRQFKKPFFLPAWPFTLPPFLILKRIMDLLLVKYHLITLNITQWTLREYMLTDGIWKVWFLHTIACSNHILNVNTIMWHKYHYSRGYKNHYSKNIKNLFLHTNHTKTWN